MQWSGWWWDDGYPYCTRVPSRSGGHRCPTFPSVWATVLASVIFSPSSISDTVRLTIVMSLSWSIFVVSCESSLSGTAKVVLNEDGFDSFRRHSALTVVATRPGYWRVHQWGEEVFSMIIARCTTISFRNAFGIGTIVGNRFVETSKEQVEPNPRVMRYLQSVNRSSPTWVCTYMEPSAVSSNPTQ